MRRTRLLVVVAIVLVALVVLAVAGVVYYAIAARQSPVAPVTGMGPAALPSEGGAMPARPEAAPALVWGRATKQTGCLASNGLPDHDCTPGDVISDEDESTVCDASFHTSSVRNSQTTSAQKQRVYAMYDIPHPANNTGANQECEIDHLVSLELGGADTIANLWPECSPGYAGWEGPGFRDKDGFENYLWYHVCRVRDLTLPVAQQEIATDWRKFWEAAGQPECHSRLRCG